MKDLILRHPTPEDAPVVLEMMVARDIAEYGEPDSSLGNLLDQWPGISVEHAECKKTLHENVVQ